MRSSRIKVYHRNRTSPNAEGGGLRGRRRVPYFASFASNFANFGVKVFDRKALVKQDYPLAIAP